MSGTMTRNDKLSSWFSAGLITQTDTMPRRCQINREVPVSVFLSCVFSQEHAGNNSAIRPRHGNSVDIARYSRGGRSTPFPGWNETTFPFQFQTISYSAPARMIFNGGTLACKGCGKERKAQRKEREYSRLQWQPAICICNNPIRNVSRDDKIGSLVTDANASVTSISNRWRVIVDQPETFGDECHAKGQGRNFCWFIGNGYVSIVLYAVDFYCP
jgi:hypothetical protein